MCVRRYFLEWSDYFYYDESSPSCLRWKIDRWVGRGNKVNWVAQWNDLSGERKSKWFSVKEHGNDEAFRLACDHRNRMIEQLNNEGAGYSYRHGILT